MQLIMLLLPFITTAVAVPASPACGQASYDPLQYQCDDGRLCPITNGDVQRRCGNACYSQYNYTCSANHTLKSLPHAVGPFLLQVLSANSSLNGQYVQACTSRFWIGDGPCTYCPQNVSRIGQCPPAGQTQLFEGSAMNVEVPGGQKYYLAPDGALSYTGINVGEIPEGAVLNATAYQDGMFIYDEVKYPPSTWMACPKINGTSLAGGRKPTPGVWQVFGILKGVSFQNRLGCVGVTLLARAGEKQFVGAWEYT
ncbi:hypothetical protein EV356DRAFT_500106 [Viridothelium virens]|uniref:Endo-1,3(4)-beta-glucanase 1 carbohydrate binding domain-containing protein n=1 Tax=Viridothelium virens TaxID=1048519 RepID=A0A6A6HC23_VIRVR|nr:hypothetical protein EV356DRAFT_500106 [Viridothelium virens]